MRGLVTFSIASCDLLRRPSVAERLLFYKSIFRALNAYYNM
jgi:hypothetical protein